MEKSHAKISDFSKRADSSLRPAVQITSFTQCISDLVYSALETGADAVAVRLDFTHFKIQVIDNGSGMTESQLNQLQISNKINVLGEKTYRSDGGLQAKNLITYKKACQSLLILSKADDSGKTHFRIWKAGKPDERSEEASQNRTTRGTTVIIDGLFFNQPIRQKLINPVVEINRIRRLISSISLTYSHVSFSLRDDATKSILLQIKKNRTLLERFYCVYPEVAKISLVEVRARVGKFEIYGIISRNPHHENNLQLVYVNKHLLFNTFVHDLLNSLLSKSFYLKGIYFKKIEKLFNFLSDTQILEDLQKLENKPSKLDVPRSSPTSQKVKYAVFSIAITCPHEECSIVSTPKSTEIIFSNRKALVDCLYSAVEQFLHPEDHAKNGNHNKENVKVLKEEEMYEKKGADSTIGKKNKLNVSTMRGLSKNKSAVLKSKDNPNFNLSTGLKVLESNPGAAKSSCFKHKKSSTKPKKNKLERSKSIKKVGGSKSLVRKDHLASDIHSIDHKIFNLSIITKAVDNADHNALAGLEISVSDSRATDINASCKKHKPSAIPHKNQKIQANLKESKRNISLMNKVHFLSDFHVKGGKMHDLPIVTESEDNAVYNVSTGCKVLNSFDFAESNLSSIMHKKATSKHDKKVRKVSKIVKKGKINKNFERNNNYSTDFHASDPHSITKLKDSANCNTSTGLEALKSNSEVSSGVNLSPIKYKEAICQPPKNQHEICETIKEDKSKSLKRKDHHPFEYCVLGHKRKKNTESILTDLTNDTFQDFQEPERVISQKQSKKNENAESVLTNLTSGTILNSKKPVECLIKNKVVSSKLQEKTVGSQFDPSNKFKILKYFLGKETACQHNLFLNKSQDDSENVKPVTKCRKFDDDEDSNASMEACRGSSKFSNTFNQNAEKLKLTENVLTDIESIATKNLEAPKIYSRSVLEAEVNLLDQKHDRESLLTNLSFSNLKPMRVGKKFQNVFDCNNSLVKKLSKKCVGRRLARKSRNIPVKIMRRQKLIEKKKHAKIFASKKTVVRNNIVGKNSLSKNDQQLREVPLKHKPLMKRMKPELSVKNHSSKASLKLKRLGRCKQPEKPKANKKSYFEIQENCKLISDKTDPFVSSARILNQDEPVVMLNRENLPKKFKCYLNESFENINMGNEKRDKIFSGSCPAISLATNLKQKKGFKENARSKYKCQSNNSFENMCLGDEKCNSTPSNTDDQNFGKSIMVPQKEKNIPEKCKHKLYQSFENFDCLEDELMLDKLNACVFSAKVDSTQNNSVTMLCNENLPNNSKHNSNESYEGLRLDGEGNCKVASENDFSSLKILHQNESANISWKNNIPKNLKCKKTFEIFFSDNLEYEKVVPEKFRLCVPSVRTLEQHKSFKINHNKKFSENFQQNKVFCLNDQETCAVVPREIPSCSFCARTSSQNFTKWPCEKNTSKIFKCNRSYEKICLNNEESSEVGLGINHSCVSPARILNGDKWMNMACEDHKFKNSRCKKSFGNLFSSNQKNCEALLNKINSCVTPAKIVSQNESVNMQCEKKLPKNFEQNNNLENLCLNNLKNHTNISEITDFNSSSATVLMQNESTTRPELHERKNCEHNLRKKFENLSVGSQEHCQVSLKERSIGVFPETVVIKDESSRKFCEGSPLKLSQQQNVSLKHRNVLLKDDKVSFCNHYFLKSFFDPLSESRKCESLLAPVGNLKPVISEVPHHFLRSLRKKNIIIDAPNVFLSARKNENCKEANNNSIGPLHEGSPQRLSILSDKQRSTFEGDPFDITQNNLGCNSKFLENSLFLNSGVSHPDGFLFQKIAGARIKNNAFFKNNFSLQKNSSQLVNSPSPPFDSNIKDGEQQNCRSIFCSRSVNIKASPYFKSSNLDHPTARNDHEMSFYKNYDPSKVKNTQRMSKLMVHPSRKSDCVYSSNMGEESEEDSSDCDPEVVCLDPQEVNKNLPQVVNVSNVWESTDSKLSTFNLKHADVSNYDINSAQLKIGQCSVLDGLIKNQAANHQTKFLDNSNTLQSLKKNSICPKDFHNDVGNLSDANNQMDECRVDTSIEEGNHLQKKNTLYSKKKSSLFIEGIHSQPISPTRLLNDSPDQANFEISLRQEHCEGSEISVSHKEHTKNYLDFRDEGFCLFQNQVISETNNDNNVNLDESSLIDLSGLILTQNRLPSSSSLNLNKEPLNSLDQSILKDCSVATDMSFCHAGIAELGTYENHQNKDRVDDKIQNQSKQISETNIFRSPSSEGNIIPCSVVKTSKDDEASEVTAKNVALNIDNKKNDCFSRVESIRKSIDTKSILVHSVSGMSFILPSIQDTLQLPKFDVSVKNRLFSEDDINFQVPKKQKGEKLLEPDQETFWGMLSRFDSFASKFSTLKSRGFGSLEKHLTGNMLTDFSLISLSLTVPEKTFIKSINTSEKLFIFEKKLFHTLEVIGQLDSKFILTVVELNDLRLIVLFDQHAVDERIRVEKLMTEYSVDFDSKVWKSIPVNPTFTINVGQEHAALCKSFSSKFEKVGLFFLVSESSLTVTQVPLCLLSSIQKTNNILHDLVLELLNEMIVSLINLNGVCPSVPGCILTAINEEACKRAVKFGDRLSLDQCKALLDGLKTCRFPFQCAHGRPLLVPVADINKFSL